MRAPAVRERPAARTRPARGPLMPAVLAVGPDSAGRSVALRSRVGIVLAPASRPWQAAKAEKPWSGGPQGKALSAARNGAGP